MYREMAMEPESTTTTLTELAGLIKEYWGYLVGVLAAAVATWGFVRKCRQKYTSVREFVTLAINAPYAVVAIQNELFENGISKLVELRGDVIGLKRMLMAETSNRRNTLNSVDTPLFECNKDGEVLWANNALLKVTGRPMERILGDNWRNSVATPDRRDVIEQFEDAVKDGTDCRLKFRLSTGDESEIWVLFEAICNKDPLDNVLGFLGKVREIRDPRNIHATEG